MDWAFQCRFIKRSPTHQGPVKSRKEKKEIIHSRLFYIFDSLQMCFKSNPTEDRWYEKSLFHL